MLITRKIVGAIMNVNKENKFISILEKFFVNKYCGIITLCVFLIFLYTKEDIFLYISALLMFIYLVIFTNLKVILYVIIVPFLFVLSEKYFGRTGKIVFIVLLLVFGIIMYSKKEWREWWYGNDK